MFNIDHLRYRIPTLVHQREMTRSTTRLCDESGVSSSSPRVLAVRCWPRSFIPLIMISVGTEAGLAFFSRFANVSFYFALPFRFEDTSHRPSGCPNSHGCGARGRQQGAPLRSSKRPTSPPIPLRSLLASLWAARGRRNGYTELHRSENKVV